VRDSSRRRPGKTADDPRAPSVAALFTVRDSCEAAKIAARHFPRSRGDDDATGWTRADRRSTAAKLSSWFADDDQPFPGSAENWLLLAHPSLSLSLLARDSARLPEICAPYRRNARAQAAIVRAYARNET